MSALIFVALAIAWAVYLIPMALRHHEDGEAARPVDRFSDRLRVLARREPVDSKTARLVVTPGRPAPAMEASDPEVVAQVGATALTPASTSARLRGRRAAAARAAQRRRRVVGVILLALVVVAVLAILGVLPMWTVALPVVVLVAWLVVCRLMVRKERAVAGPVATARESGREAAADVVAPATEDELDDAPEADELDAGPLTEEISAVQAEEVSPTPESGGWDPVPVTLPTYVGKDAAARRSVRTIDLDSTGVWTSGRTEADSALAREADDADRTVREARSYGGATRAPDDGPQRRASGS